MDELRALGIETAVSTDSPDWPEQARALVADGQIMHGIESLGGDGASQLAGVMAHGAATKTCAIVIARNSFIGVPSIIADRGTHRAIRPTMPMSMTGLRPIRSDRMPHSGSHTRNSVLAATLAISVCVGSALRTAIE